MSRQTGRKTNNRKEGRMTHRETGELIATMVAAGSTNEQILERLRKEACPFGRGVVAALIDVHRRKRAQHPPEALSAAG